MKIVENKFIPFKGHRAINIFGVVFTRDLGNFLSKKSHVRHEYTHTLQYKELWYIGFLPVYLYYWVKNLLKGMSLHKAYRNIPLEIEAYLTENTEWYNDHREKFAWKKYINSTYC